jgi:hypothetical protein
VAGTIVKDLWAPGLGRYVVRHPADAVVLARAGWRLRGDGWLGRWPFLPLPDAHYWRFRVVTVNGSSSDALSPASMVEAAKWAVAQPLGRHS